MRIKSNIVRDITHRHPYDILYDSLEMEPIKNERRNRKKKSWFIYFAIDHLPISAHTCAIGLVQSYCFIFCASILIWTIARYGHGLRQRHLAWDLIIGKDNLIDANSMRPRIASKIEWIHYLVLG